MNGFYTGNISSIDHERGFVKVTFPTEGNTVSDWLPLLYSEYNLPEVGSVVAVLVDEHGNGVCFGKIYSCSQIPAVRSGYYKKLGNATITESGGTLVIKADKIILDGYTPPVTEGAELNND